jgi:hypothetical protein
MIAVMLLSRDHLLRGVVLGAALLGLSAVAGCTSQPSRSDTGKSDQVATIAGASAAASSAAPAGRTDGAMVRIDMTQAETDALYDTYYACLRAHGVRMLTKGGHQVPAQEEKDAPAGYRACKAKEPYLDPLLDKTKNPHYADQFRDWLACMNRNGVEVSGSPDDKFLKFGKRKAGIDGKKYLEIYRQCDMASYKW